MTLILIFIWPILSIPAGVFSKNYFAFWVLVAIAWGFGAAIVITVLPLTESQEDIFRVTNGMWSVMTGKGRPALAADETDIPVSITSTRHENGTRPPVVTTTIFDRIVGLEPSTVLIEYN